MTTATLRPNATVTFTGAVTGGATAYSVTSDNADGTYFEGGGIFGMTTVAMGAGAVVKNLAMRCRCRGVVGIEKVAFSDNSGHVYDFGGGVDSTLRTYGFVPYVTNLSQAGVDALTMSTFSVVSGAIVASSNLRVVEIYADLVYVEQPVTAVTAVTPDPYTASSVVPISWTNTLDTDGGAQSRYRLNVFSAAQYGAGGFDPETSATTFDVGEVTSGATSRSTGALSNGTYRAYVKVAQTVNGASHWSDWSYDQFTINVPTSDVLSVTAAGSDPGAYIAVTVNRNTGSHAWEFVEVERSTDSGATWSPVRTATFTAATGDTFTVDDYETANGDAALYRARATYYSSGLPITGAWVETSAAASWSSLLLWLKSPTNPTLNYTFKMAATVNSQSTMRRGVFQVIGAALPVVISDVRSGKSGNLTFRTLTPEDATALDAIIVEPVLLIHAPQSWTVPTTYISLGTISRDRGPKADTNVSTWSADYVEVAQPADPLASAP